MQQTTMQGTHINDIIVEAGLFLDVDTVRYQHK